MMNFYKYKIKNKKKIINFFFVYFFLYTVFLDGIKKSTVYKIYFFFQKYLNK